MPDLLANWAGWYANAAWLRTLVVFLHIGGLAAGGGCAIGADLLTLRAARRGAAERAAQLGILSGTHRIVIGGLTAVIGSGLLQLAAAPATFLRSWIFWTKMGMVALLLANGWLLMGAERRAAAELPGGWRRLAASSRVSLALWLSITLAGAALLNL